MTSKEAEIRSIQRELDPAFEQHSENIREKIVLDLKEIEAQLKSSRIKKEELAEVASRNPNLSSYIETIGNLEKLLDDKERMILILEDELATLSERASELEEEVALSHRDIEYLERETQEKEAQVDEQNHIIDSLREELGTAYYFVGSDSQISTAVAREELKKAGRTYHAPDGLTSGEIPRGFRTASPEQNYISLGHRLRRVKVISVHRRYETLFGIRRRGDEWFLFLEDPLAFWSISRYLVVEVEP